MKNKPAVPTTKTKIVVPLTLDNAQKLDALMAEGKLDYLMNHEGIIKLSVLMPE